MVDIKLSIADGPSKVLSELNKVEDKNEQVAVTLKHGFIQIKSKTQSNSADSHNNLQKILTKMNGRSTNFARNGFSDTKLQDANNHLNAIYANKNSSSDITVGDLEHVFSAVRGSQQTAQMQSTTHTTLSPPNYGGYEASGIPTAADENSVGGSLGLMSSAANTGVGNVSLGRSGDSELIEQAATSLQGGQPSIASTKQYQSLEPSMIVRSAWEIDSLIAEESANNLRNDHAFGAKGHIDDVETDGQFFDALSQVSSVSSQEDDQDMDGYGRELIQNAFKPSNVRYSNDDKDQYGNQYDNAPMRNGTITPAPSDLGDEVNLGDQSQEDWVILKDQDKGQENEVYIDDARIKQRSSRANSNGNLGPLGNQYDDQNSQPVMPYVDDNSVVADEPSLPSLSSDVNEQSSKFDPRQGGSNNSDIARGSQWGAKPRIDLGTRNMEQIVAGHKVDRQENSGTFVGPEFELDIASVSNPGGDLVGVKPDTGIEERIDKRKRNEATANKPADLKNDLIGAPSKDVNNQD